MLDSRTALIASMLDRPLSRFLDVVADYDWVWVYGEVTPLFRQTAAYGHFGRTDLDLPWERLDRVEHLREAITGRGTAQSVVRA